MVWGAAGRGLQVLKPVISTYLQINPLNAFVMNFLKNICAKFHG